MHPGFENLYCFKELHQNPQLVYSRGSDGKFELDFESDKTDIINSGHQELDFAGGLLSRPIREHMPEYGRSLRVSKTRIDWSK